MGFEVKLSDKAKQHRKELEPRIKNLIDDAIDNIEQEGPNHEKVGFLTDQRFSDTLLYRYKILEGEANHRIIFDVIENAKIRIFDLGHRDWIYER